jgi:hypothetical protein
LLRYGDKANARREGGGGGADSRYKHRSRENGSATTLGDAEFVPRRAIRSMKDQVALEAGQVAYLRNQTMRSIRQCLSKIGIIP